MQIKVNKVVFTTILKPKLNLLHEKLKELFFDFPSSICFLDFYNNDLSGFHQSVLFNTLPHPQDFRESEKSHPLVRPLKAGSKERLLFSENKSLN